jgi:Uma2 family endonuclease
MSATTVGQSMTADELLHLPSGQFRYELVKGELIQMTPAGFEHGVTIVDITEPLSRFVRENRLGVVSGAETGFRLESDPDTVRAPDVAFVSTARIPTGRTPGFFPGAPDLAVEVVSPGDTVQEVDDKVTDWLEGGARLVWIARPSRRSVEVHRADGSVSLLSAQDRIEGEDVLPGFVLPVAQIFR